MKEKLIKINIHFLSINLSHHLILDKKSLFDFVLMKQFKRGSSVIQFLHVGQIKFKGHGRFLTVFVSLDQFPWLLFYSLVG